jgi:hypothetical protein
MLPWWDFSDTDEATTFGPGPPPTKRARGRPSKTPSLDWFRNPPPHVRKCTGTNIVIDDWRQLVGENRREQVSKGVLAAYRAGGNTANKNRARAKTWALAKMKTANAKVIANSSMTAAAIAERIIRAGTNYGLGWRAICDEISRLKKETRGSDF